MGRIAYTVAVAVASIAAFAVVLAPAYRELTEAVEAVDLTGVADPD